MKGETSLVAHSDFGLAGIFDNVRDGLILVRFPEREIVLFNKAAGEMSGVPPEKAMGKKLESLISDRAVHATMRKCAQSAVGVWPGHVQDVLQTNFKTRKKNEDGIELHFCRVDPAALAGPLVLLVIRPRSEVELESAVRSYSSRSPVKPVRGLRPTPRHVKRKASPKAR